jgi:hypothetical protein
MSFKYLRKILRLAFHNEIFQSSGKLLGSATTVSFRSINHHGSFCYTTDGFQLHGTGPSSNASVAICIVHADESDHKAEGSDVEIPRITWVFSLPPLRDESLKLLGTRGLAHSNRYERRGVDSMYVSIRLETASKTFPHSIAEIMAVNHHHGRIDGSWNTTIY